MTLAFELIRTYVRHDIHDPATTPATTIVFFSMCFSFAFPACNTNH